MNQVMMTLPATTLLCASAEAKWAPAEMNQVKQLSDPRLSPDNRHLLFVVTEAVATKTKNQFVSRIYKTESSGNSPAAPFSSTEHSSYHPRWSPDGTRVAFLSKRGNSVGLYLIQADGGEATPLVHEKRDVKTFEWSPDGKKIAFVMIDDKEEEKERKKTSSAYLFAHDTTITRLWLLDLSTPGAEPKPLTDDTTCVHSGGDFGTISTEFDWSPNSREIVFAFSPRLGFDAYHLDSSLATVDIETGRVKQWEKKAVYESMPRYSPDGKNVAYLVAHTDHRYAINRQLAIRSRDGEKFQLLAETPNQGSFLFGPTLLGWNSDGNGVLTLEPSGTKFKLFAVGINGSCKEVPTGDLHHGEISLSKDGSHLAFVGQTSNTPPEIYISKIVPFHPTQLSLLNRSFLANPLPKTEKVAWKSKDGLQIEGLLTYPEHYTPGKAVPLLLIVHGGPMGFFQETFIASANVYPIAAFAEAGFAVFRPNPRGSTGYGKEFRIANYHDWGGMDAEDLLSGVDFLIAQGIADPSKLGVMGWSYGGYMTARLLTLTNRFKAASMGAGPYNLFSQSSTTDLHRLLPDYLGNHLENHDFYRDRSPIFAAAKVATPCLIQHGETDQRVPVSQAYEWYRALELAGQSPTLILFPNSGHHISDPKARLDAMQQNLSWFRHHLQ
jgi:dipeptidyl aminopeptidase/acylaminoacyl peptidase